MQTEFLRIKCPNCGAVLTLKNMIGLENKSIPCPICKKVSRYVDYKKPTQQASQYDTDNTTTIGDATQLGDKLHNNLSPKSIGKLKKPKTNELYPLSLGKNTIGRKAQSSHATIQINTDDHYMSRIHSVIEVCKKQNGDYIHCLSNAQNKNTTYVNSLKIEKDDRIVLHEGDTLKMANTMLQFVFDSEDETTI